MRNTKWNIKNIPKDKDIKINNIPVDKDILKILFSREIKSPGEIRNFLNRWNNMSQRYYGNTYWIKKILIILNLRKMN